MSNQNKSSSQSSIQCFYRWFCCCFISKTSQKITPQNSNQQTALSQGLPIAKDQKQSINPKQHSVPNSQMISLRPTLEENQIKQTIKITRKNKNDKVLNDLENKSPQQPEKIPNDKKQISQIQKLKQQQYASQINKFEQLIQKISSVTPQTDQDQEELAFAYASLTNLYILTGNTNYQETAKKALQIYQKRSSLYIEQIITLKNNLALGLEKHQRINNAISLYSQVLQMQQKFYSMSDIRLLSTLNNIFCLYMNNNQSQKGLEIYKKYEAILESMDRNQQIYQLVKQNYEYYSQKIKIPIKNKQA